MQDTILTALRGGDTAAAVAAARSWAQAEPDNAEAHHTFGLALRQLGDVSNADAAFARAISLAPERATYHLSRAVLAAQVGAADRARFGFTEALKHDPNQLLAYLGLAELAIAHGQLEPAEQHLRFAERIAPEHPHIEALAAQVQLARGEGAAALRRMQHANQRVPNDATVLGVLGLCYLNQRHAAFAEQALRQALNAQPQARTLRFGLVNALLIQGRLDEAADETATLIAQNPADLRALTLSGQIAVDRGYWDEAIAALTQSLRRGPLQPHALDALLGAYLESGDRDAAQAFLDEMLQTHPSLDFAWSALVKFNAQDLAAAAVAAQRWAAARPDVAAAHEVAAQCVEATGDVAQAQTLAQRAVTLEPNSLGAQLVLARGEVARGAADAACERIAQLRRTLQQPQLDAELAAWHAHFCEAAGRVEEAAEHWRVANPPSDADARGPAPDESTRH